MRPDRTTPRVLALFQERWQGGFIPVKMIVKEVRERGPPVSRRSVETALAKAVRLGHLRVAKGTDDGAAYGLASYASANPSVVRLIERTPLRMLQRQIPGVESKAMRRWIHADGLKGMHDYRPGHKCIPCGNRPHRNPDFPDIADRRNRETTGMRLVRDGPSVA
jgi:hypothetical protein